MSASSAPIPIDEARRLVTLQACEILDTSPERAFGELVNLAARQLNVPIALISLVDEKRQWFKAAVGLEIRETSREHAFCAHTILASDVFVVENATDDPRFSENPLVTGEPGIRFYAGAPIEMSDGTRLGTLCVIDVQPRRLDSDQIAVLQTLARQVTCQLEL